MQSQVPESSVPSKNTAKTTVLHGKESTHASCRQVCDKEVHNLYTSRATM